MKTTTKTQSRLTPEARAKIAKAIVMKQRWQLRKQGLTTTRPSEQKRTGAQSETDHSAGSSSPQNGAKDNDGAGKVHQNSWVNANLSSALDATQRALDELTDAAAREAGVSIEAFRKLPVKEQKSFLAQARGEKATGVPADAHPMEKSGCATSARNRRTCARCSWLIASLTRATLMRTRREGTSLR
jgi:hypothetical protein